MVVFIYTLLTNDILFVIRVILLSFMFQLAGLRTAAGAGLSGGGLGEARSGLAGVRSNLLGVRVSCWAVIGRIGCCRFVILRTCGRVCSSTSSLRLSQKIL